MESRLSLDEGYVPHYVKNRRYRALQKMVNEGEYFSETNMKQRSPHLYEHYVGRYLTTEEKEQKLKENSYTQPPTLSEFFMEVIDRKEQEEKMDEMDVEEFDTDSSEEEDTAEDISEEEKQYMREEFISRMFQSFLDGHDKDFAYKEVDENMEYDDMKQISQDEEDEYFDGEEPSTSCNISNILEDNGSSEDELDKYMRTLDSANVPSQFDEERKDEVT